LAVLHDVVLVDLPQHDLGGVPAPITAGLLLIPVIYAALNFGVRGAVGTALTSTAVITAHWLQAPDLTAIHIWIEGTFLLVVNAVAIVVGQRVESEQRARLRAETALRAARAAQTRYHSLFENQPAPIIITAPDGIISELNSAASRLFGDAATGQPLRVPLRIDPAELLNSQPSHLTVDLPTGEQRLFVPTAHELTSDGDNLVQVILTDVTEQRRRQEEQQLFAARLLWVQEDERRRLARELHDDPLQNLTYLTRALDDISHTPHLPDSVGEQLGHAGAVAAEAATALRKLIHGLRPPVLDDLGLVSALRQLAEEVRGRTSLTIRFTVAGTPIRLPPDLELAAYRIAQESLNNVVRHAHATRAQIHLRFADTLALTVSDDGRGIPRPGTADKPRNGLGLIGMRERVSMARGTLDVKGRRPHGTLVRATLPLGTRESAD
jgi:signal transduction histidine kinase